MRALLQHPIAAVFALLAAVIVAAMTFAIVPETQQAVVLRLNNPQRVVNQWQPGQTIGNSGAGLIARVPLIDSIVWLDKRVLDADLDNTLVLSTDQLRLNVDAFARFRIVNPLRAVTSTGSTSNTEERVADQLRPLLGTALRNRAAAFLAVFVPQMATSAPASARARAMPRPMPLRSGSLVGAPAAANSASTTPWRVRDRPRPPRPSG